jgi:hypothetical protein
MGFSIPLMTDLALIERVLQLASLGATLLLVIHLPRHGLHRIYPSFYYFLVFDLVRSLAVLPLSPNQTLYGTIYLATEPIRWVFYFMIVRELYGLILQRHPGIESAGKFTLTAGIVLSAAFSLATLSQDIVNASGLYPVLHTVNVLSRAIVTTLVFFLVVIAAFLVWFPIPLPRNTVYYFSGYAVFFVSKGLVYLARNLAGPDITRAASVLNLFIAVLCISFWFLKLRSEGERREVTVGHRWNQQEADRLLEQLESINSSLARGGRR